MFKYENFTYELNFSYGIETFSHMKCNLHMKYAHKI